LSAVSSLTVATAGCGNLDYAFSAIAGQFRLLSSVEPIEVALEDPSLSEEQRDKLAFVVRVRDYAEHVIGLNAGDSYRSFANLGDEPLAWNLSAARKDAFEAYFWDLPLVGSLPYLGFFDYDQALAERDRLVDEGWDTLVYEVDAYSTIGLLPDPLTSALLRRDRISLADTVMHELLHNTIFQPGETTFNESMATFVGRQAGLEFLAFEYGAGSDVLVEAHRNYQDEDRHAAFIAGLIAEVRTLYEQDLSSEEKIAQREAIFESGRQRYATEVLPYLHDRTGYETYTTFKYNNAFLLANVRYNNDQDVFAAVYEMTGRNWAHTLSIFAEAANAPMPFQYLRDVVGPEHQ
jgi:predicted aminopeptidase